jgi:hypothetical protein
VDDRARGSLFDARRVIRQSVLHGDCNDSGTDNTSNTSYDGSCETEDNISAKTTFSGDVGLGFSNGRLGLEGRYSWDWGDAFEVANGTFAGTSLNIKNSVWSILIRLSK